MIELNKVICDKVKSVHENGGTLSTVTAFALLREELIKNIGMERVKGFLLRYGYELGVNAGRNALAMGLPNFEDVVKQGPDFHSTFGHVKGVQYTVDMVLNQDEKIRSICGKGTWEGSFEGLEHLKRFGKADSPICYSLRGYVSGFMTTISGLPIFAKETSCIAMGDSVCRWEFKLLEAWGEEIEEEYHYYSESTIIKDFKYTYEQLLEQRNYIYQVDSLHKKLTEAVTNGCDLQTIAENASDTAGIPIIINDVNFQTFAYAGMSKEQFKELNEEVQQWMGQEAKNFAQNHEILYKTPFLNKKLIKICQHYHLVAPIIVRKNILGYCSFIYTNNNQNLDKDYMLLERIANAASLVLLNEKTSFESFERMKGNFLEQLLDGQFSSRAEILKRGRFMNIDLGKKYYVGVLMVNHHKDSINHEFILHERLLEASFSYFKEQNHPVIAVQRHGKFVLLLPVTHSNALDVQIIAENYVNYLELKIANCRFQFGISSKADKIEWASKYYEEALIACRLGSKKKVLMFESLGIVGMLINQNNETAIRMMAEQLLGDFYNCRDPKNAELIKTLYTFLTNGGKLEQTMRDLSLSMSGLLYRIQKIESVIGKDLRNPADSHQVFLVLEALIAMGELDIS